MVYFTLPVIQDGDHAKIPHPGDVMSDQNPYPGDIRDSQIPVGCPTPPLPSGFTVIGALQFCTHKKAPVWKHFLISKPVNIIH